MSYLYQQIMNVPGLNGNSGQRQSDLYNKLGSPYGGYTGSYQQNSYLLDQIGKGNYGQTQLTQPSQSSNGQPISQVNSLVNNTTGMLAPQKAYSDVMNYNTFAQPNNALFNTFQNQATNEFNNNTYNPYLEAQGNNSAANNSGMLGGTANALNIANRQETMPFYNQLEGARQNINNLTTQQYNQGIGNYYGNSQAFTNKNNPNQLNS